MVPFRKGADGVVNHNLRFAMRFETLLVSDHPVCGASVASRLFVEAAATLLGKEGKTLRLSGAPLRGFEQHARGLGHYCLMTFTT